MRVRLVTLRRRRSGPPAERVELLDVDALGLGRGTDNAIVLPGLSVALRHAEIRLRAGHAWLEPIGAAELRVNGRPVREGRPLVPGDALQIAGHELRVRAPEADEALRLEIEARVEPAAAREELARRARLADEPRWLGRRSLSWLLGLGIPALFLAAPLATGRLATSWSSGPLSRPHSFFAEDCRRCHEGSFRPVQDEACLACHPQVGHHVAEPLQELALAGTRCAECHTEHEGPSGLARLEQRRCAECHAALHARFPESELPDASDFAADHPDFTPEGAPRDHEPQARRARSEAQPSEVNDAGLRFSHLQHVGGGVRDLATGKRRFLPCAECHEPEPGGAGFEPVGFEAHCRSCHALGYAPDQPERQAPHGDPVALRAALASFYQGEALRGGVADPGAPAVLRRRAPGRTLAEPERRAALDWADAKAREAERYLLEKPGECAGCHTVQPGAAADGGAAIAPVQVAAVWLRAARFRHARHAPFPCRDCHAAAAVFAPDPASAERPDWSLAGPGHAAALFTPEELRTRHGLAPSEAASDVLLPGIASCRTCHGGARARPPRVASDCVLCHAFHHEELGPLRSAGARRGG